MRFLLPLSCLACGAPEPTPPPQAEPKTALAVAPPSESDRSVLVARWPDGLAVVACISADGVQTGEACTALLPAGTPLGELGTSTGPKPLGCMVPGDEVPGIGVKGGAPMPTAWAWVPAAPEGWTEASIEPADDALSARVRGHAEVGDEVEVGIALHAELDGVPGEERLARTYVQVDDPDKPGRSQLWLVDAARVRPLPSPSPLQGVQEVIGMLPLEGGGALVAFTSRWMGGSGIHAVTAVEGQLVPLGQAACGT